MKQPFLHSSKKISSNYCTFQKVAELGLSFIQLTPLICSFTTSVLVSCKPYRTSCVCFVQPYRGIEPPPCALLSAKCLSSGALLPLHYMIDRNFELPAIPLCLQPQRYFYIRSLIRLHQLGMPHIKLSPYSYIIIFFKKFFKTFFTISPHLSRQIGEYQPRPAIFVIYFDGIKFKILLCIINQLVNVLLLWSRITIKKVCNIQAVFIDYSILLRCV